MSSVSDGFLFPAPDGPLCRRSSAKSHPLCRGEGMNCSKLRVALLAAALVSASSAGADQGPAAATSAPCGPAAAPAAAPAAPAMQTICVREWVPETYQTTRTVYRTESRVENYTAYRTE